MGDFITRNPAETRSCGSAEETDCRKLLLETLETDKNNVEIPLQTQTTTRQRYDEIKKKKKKLDGGKVGNDDVLAFVQSRRDSLMAKCGLPGLGMGAPEHICPLLPAIFFFFTFLPIVITPSSLLRRTRTRPRSRSTPQRCGVTGWWPRHCRHARA